MDEEHKQKQPAPPRFRYKGFKFLTLALFFLLILAVFGLSGIKATSSSKFCSSCHEMKPEYYTWKASSHNEVDCINCHTDPMLKKLAKDKAEGVFSLIKSNSANPNVKSAAPVVATSQVPNSACEKCHNMKTRQVTASGDIIIPHDKHLAKNIECVQCHSGIAHGDIADRKMTYQTDLDKWDQKVGNAAMAELKFTRPDMDTCMECHIARKATTECSACHKTGMIPKSHKSADFKTKTHGKLAAKDLKKCNQCHNGMSKNPLVGYGEVSVVDRFLNKVQIQQKDQYTYAKENTFCKDCHSKKPASHDSKFFSKHGEAAKNITTCKACHDVKLTSTSGGNQVNCSSCHPSSHSQKTTWKERHPISLVGVKGPSETCYRCHAQNRCTACHKE